MKATIFRFMTMFLIANAGWASDIQLGQPIAAGNGCSNGSLNVLVSTDEQTIFMSADEFVAETGPQNRMDRKNCQIAIPFHLAEDLQVRLVPEPLQAFVALKEGAQAEFVMESYVAGASSLSSHQVMTGPTENNVILATKPTNWSRCGGQAVLRVNMIMTVRTDAKLSPALISLESGSFHIEVRRCSKSGN